MRVWGRIKNAAGKLTWVMVTTAADGSNDEVYITALAQVLKLNLGESPFYGNFGIPQHQTLVTQVYPDYYVAYTQQQYAQYFSSLMVAREDYPYPRYKVNVLTHAGVSISATVPIPQ
jgi:hypothetical protein